MGRVLLLIVGFVVALGVMGASQPQSAGKTEKGAARPSVEQSLETIATAAAKTVEPVESPEYERPCQPGQDRRNSDLCAQWKAADGAVRGAEWSKWQTILSALGLIGLFYSLHLTRKAVGAATDASEDADAALVIAARNADAATRHVEIAQNAAERELRAYLSVDQIRCQKVVAGQVPEIWITLKNRGKTPARRIVVKTCVIRCHTGVPDSAAIVFDAGKPLYDLGPGQKTAQPSLLTKEALTEDQAADMRKGTVTHVYAGYIRYFDVFGRTRRVIFRANLIKEGIAADGSGYLSMAEKHTRST